MNGIFINGVDSVAMEPSQILRTPQLYLLTFSLALACMGGLMMIEPTKIRSK